LYAPKAGFHRPTYHLGRRLTADRRRRVHEAWDTRLQRTVALVLITPAPGRDPDPTLPTPPGAAVHVHHPGIVELYDGGIHQGELFLVCQRVPGPTLATSGRRAVDLGALVCRLARTLAPVHRLGAAHGALTPERVLLDGPRPMTPQPDRRLRGGCGA
jgi:hypothetical protein